MVNNQYGHQPKISFSNPILSLVSVFILFVGMKMMRRIFRVRRISHEKNYAKRDKCLEYGSVLDNGIYNGSKG